MACSSRNYRGAMATAPRISHPLSPLSPVLPHLPLESVTKNLSLFSSQLHPNTISTTNPSLLHPSPSEFLDSVPPIHRHTIVSTGIPFVSSPPSKNPDLVAPIQQNTISSTNSPLVSPLPSIFPDLEFQNKSVAQSLSQPDIIPPNLPPQSSPIPHPTIRIQSVSLDSSVDKVQPPMVSDSNTDGLIGPQWFELPPMDEEDSVHANDASDLMLLGRVVSDRKVSPHAVQEVIFKAWAFAPSLQIEDLKQNQFLFLFEAAEERELALARGPWNIRGSLLVLKKWPFGMS